MTARTDGSAAEIERARACVAHGLAALADLASIAPAEVDAVLSMLVHRLRSWRPDLVAAAGAGWPSSPRSVP